MSVYDITGNIIRDEPIYDIYGNIIDVGYDIYGNIVYSRDSNLITLPDTATGNYSGYTLRADRSHINYRLMTFINFFALGEIRLQSMAYNADNGLYYKFDDSDTVEIFNQSGASVGTVTLPEYVGHNNDADCINGKIYMPYMLRVNRVVEWTIATNTIRILDVPITNPDNGSLRSIDGLCILDSDHLYIFCTDLYNNDSTIHQPGDSLAIYKYTISTGASELMCEIPWDCVFGQGCTYYKGIIYCSCNMQTTPANNYKGITIKCIRTDTWELLDELKVFGNFEGEGMDIFPSDNGVQQLAFGMGKFNSMSQYVECSIPYELANY